MNKAQIKLLLRYNHNNNQYVTPTDPLLKYLVVIQEHTQLFPVHTMP